MDKHRAGFTLIEILVVIVILSVLIALLLPSIGKALDEALQTRAASMINQVKTGLTQYNAEYNTWPYDGGTPAPTGASTTTLSTTAAYTLLLGDPTQKFNGTTYANPRGIKYCDFAANDLDNQDTLKATKFVTPWKVNGIRLDYFITVDGNNTNQLAGIPDITQTGAGATTTINAECAVWCSGTPVNGAANTNPQKFIRSW